MFEILGIDMKSIGEYLSGLDRCEDPYIIDVRNQKDLTLKGIMGKDYLYLVELQKSPRYVKGLNYFRVQSRGKAILSRVIGNALKFDREIIFLYTDDEHYLRLLELVREEIKCQQKKKPA